MLFRDAEVLSLFATIIDTLGSLMESHVTQIFDAVFECTLMMITRNFEDYPDHRIKFFSLLRAIATKCSKVIFNQSQLN